MSVTDRPTRRGELMQSPGSDGWTVYEHETDSLHVLNDSAKAIWELCDGETSPSEMASAISELTGISSTQANEDVQLVLKKLVASGLVVVSD